MDCFPTGARLASNSWAVGEGRGATHRRKQHEQYAGNAPCRTEGLSNSSPGGRSRNRSNGRRIRDSSLLGSIREGIMEQTDAGHTGHVIGWAQVKFRAKKPQFWRVCFDCRDPVEGPFKRGKVPDAESVSLWTRKQWYEWRGVNPPRSKAQRIRERGSWRARYKTYLQSPAWAEVRRARLALDGGDCQCGARAEHVHHLNYRRFGRERMEDLLSVCRACHSKLHGRPV